MPNMFTDKKLKTHTHTYTGICIHIQKKGERTTSKFKNHKIPHDTHLHSHKKKPLVKPKTTPTHL